MISVEHLLFFIWSYVALRAGSKKKVASGKALDMLVKHPTEGHLKIVPVVALDALVKRQAIRSCIARFRFLPHHIPSVARSSSIQGHV
jgi:hypothetical protein